MYYVFPKEVDPHTRYLNGAEPITINCTLGTWVKGDRSCSLEKPSCGGCEHFRVTDSSKMIFSSSEKRAGGGFSSAFWVDFEQIMQWKLQFHSAIAPAEPLQGFFISPALFP
jgi:hypothetical protein